MTKNTLVVLGCIAAFITVLFIGGGIAVGAYNGASSLKNTYEMKVKSNSAEFDNMFKKLKQVVQIPEQKKQAFREVFENYAKERSTGGDKQIMTWITEAVPNVDLNIYDQILNIITGSRDSWTMKQTELVSIAEQYNRKLSVFPSNVILGVFGFEKIDPKVITSTHTDEVFASGKDDDVLLFDTK